MELMEVDLFGIQPSLNQALFRAFNFSAPWQESEYTALLVYERLADRRRHSLINPPLPRAAKIMSFYWERPTFRAHDWRIVKQHRQPCIIQRCGHRQDAQVWAEGLLNIKC